MRYLISIIALFCTVVVADARPRHVTYTIDPGCNVLFPCEGVAASPRGARVVRAMGGFGSARKVYRPTSGAVVAHPIGCPSTAFCGCGAAVRVFGAPVRSLWLAANWFRFPRTAPGAGMVAVRRHHVMVLEADLGGGMWRVFDANGGRHMTFVHPRSLAGYTIVNPHG